MYNKQLLNQKRLPTRVIWCTWLRLWYDEDGISHYYKLFLWLTMPSIFASNAQAGTWQYAASASASKFLFISAAEKKITKQNKLPRQCLRGRQGRRGEGSLSAAPFRDLPALYVRTRDLCLAGYLHIRPRGGTALQRMKVRVRWIRSIAGVVGWDGIPSIFYAPSSALTIEVQRSTCLPFRCWASWRCPN